MYALLVIEIQVTDDGSQSHLQYTGCPEKLSPKQIFIELRNVLCCKHAICSSLSLCVTFGLWRMSRHGGNCSHHTVLKTAATAHDKGGAANVFCAVG